MASRTAFPSLEPWFRSVMRIVIGFTFCCHGMQKLFGLFGGLGGRSAHVFTLLWLAGIIETFGGWLILLGLFTVPVALILCGEMAYAYFTVHFPRGPIPFLDGGELAVVYCFIFLLLIAAGPGPISLDRLIRGKYR